MTVHLFTVIMAVDDTEFSNAGDPALKAQANPTAAMTHLLQRDLYDDLGMSGEFEIIGYQKAVQDQVHDAIAMFRR